MKAETGFDDDKMKEKIKNYLKLDLSSAVAEELNETERLMAYNAQVMRHQLEKAGQETDLDNVMKQIKLKDEETA